MTPVEETLRADLRHLYGAELLEPVWTALARRMDAFRQSHPVWQRAPADLGATLSQADTVLITYGDQIQEKGTAPLQTLDEALTRLIGEAVTAVHLLPFYPYSSDDGFSVIDYRAVHPDWGSWEDIRRMGRHFRLMFDAVINHISRQSAWFQGFCEGQAPYQDYFVTVDPATDLSQVVRPRALPLLTPVETARGTEHVWTTFSADQIDLNYASPRLLLEVIDVLLFYVEQGARLLRLDAIAFMWKEVGTPCIHLPQTHRIIKLIRAVMDAVAPGVLLITETNVPHEENISYFGDGTDEAHMVYQFPLPPLTLHAFLSGDATVLQRWASTLETPSGQTTFFNFLASHDGIGLRPAEGLLSQDQLDLVVARAEAHGGYVSYRAMPDGTKRPYELNIVYFDALNDPEADEPPAVQVDRFMAAQAILLSLAGVPGIYVHSLFGSRNWREGVTRTGHHRTINRQKFERARLEAELADPSTIRHRVFHRYRALIEARAGEPAFHPNGAQQILDTTPAFFSLVRTAPDGGSRVLCIHNVTGRPQHFDIRPADAGLQDDGSLRDLLTGERVPVDAGALGLTLPPYGVRWLQGR